MEDVLPKVVFTVFGLPVRDTVVATWAMILLVLLAAAFINRRKPTALEMLVDFLADLISGILGRPAAPYLPLLGSLAIFIAVANVIGFIPFLLSPTRDINTPLALALVVFLSVHFFGIRSKGLVRYLKDMASPIYLLPLEIIGQLSRTLSLTLRLFGNIFSAELILVIVIALAPLFVPLPLAGLGIFTGLLQAYIFTALAAVYIGAGVEAVAEGKRKEKG
ncbi:MAG: F0F1 ATP synthase subunit A [Anaerolineales bacterium]|nr:F0F1 ATP synthase subunit A [Anaerolineales bacterium]